MIFLAVGLTTGCPLMPGGCLPDQTEDNTSPQPGERQDDDQDDSRTDLLGDLNDDGIVDVEDLNLFLGMHESAFGSTAAEDAYIPEADLNNDGVIGWADLQLFEDLLDE
jgi:hypothetical protein